MNFLKKAIQIISILVLIPLFFVLMLFLNFQLISLIAKSNLYDEIKSVPPHTYTLVLGAGHYKPELWTNYTLINRINAAVELFQHAKTKKIIVSGIRRNNDDDEAGDMKKMLLELGVPDSVIIVDTIGMRTWVSVNNSKTIFAADSLIIVSQQGQLERAVFIAECLNISAIGFVAHAPPWNFRHLKYREYLARAKALLDCIAYKFNFS